MINLETMAREIAKIIKAEIGKVGGVHHIDMWVKPIEQALQAVRDDAAMQMREDAAQIADVKIDSYTNQAIRALPLPSERKEP